MYPSLLGGEWFTSSISRCVEDIQDCTSIYDNSILNVQCLTHFSEVAVAKGTILNDNYVQDTNKSQIVRDHPVESIKDFYPDMDMVFNPIVLYTKKPDLWWTVRWETLFKILKRTDIDTQWMRTNVQDTFTQTQWDILEPQLPEFVNKPDLVTYAYTGKFIATDMETHRQEQTRYLKKSLRDAEQYYSIFPEPRYTVNMDTVLLGKHERFYAEVKQIFPTVDTDKLGTLLDEWRSRQKI